MNVTVTSGGISALIAALALIGTANVYVINAVFDRRMRHFIKELNGTYVRSSGAHVTGHELETRLEKAEADVRELLQRT
jgi:hypothetical protein